MIASTDLIGQIARRILLGSIDPTGSSVYRTQYAYLLLHFSKRLSVLVQRVSPDSRFKYHESV